MAFPIETIYIYQGHKWTLKEGFHGPYWDNVLKQTEMFESLNKHRENTGRALWKIGPVVGEDLISTLKKCDQQRTLLVFPAGQSSHYDQAFSLSETKYIQEEFLSKGGGRVYGTCGAAYWLTETREYDGLCSSQPIERKVVFKKSPLPLLQGVAKGPLCPFPGQEYKVGFYSDAVTVEGESSDCTIYLSGGGSFFPSLDFDQRVSVLARYKLEELQRLGYSEGNANAAVLAEVGNGAALLAMFHPYYGPSDIDVQRYEKTFPKEKSGTDWAAVHARLSSLEERIVFFDYLMRHLEERDFDKINF